MNKKGPNKQGEQRQGTRGRGRPPGSPNKVTATVKMLVLGTLDDLGGKRWLKKLAKEHPQTFAQLLAKIMPTQVVGDVNYRYVAEMPAPEGDPEEWIRKYAPKPPTHQGTQTRN